MRRDYCTLFDSGYLLKGVAMISSLRRYNPESVIHVLCMDQKTYEILENISIENVCLIRLDEIEDKELLSVKSERGRAEYCWTLSPCLPWYLMQHNSEIEFITYLDADLFFYSSVDPIFKEIGSASVVVIEHRFSDRLRYQEVNGRFCVEWVSFRRDPEGMACLSRWRDQCIEWCFYRLEDGKMGDQKYLDEWPNKYSSCYILQHQGAGIAPWNYEQYIFGFDSSGQITVQSVPLIFYHFHQFQLLDDGKYDRLSSFYTSYCKEPEAVYERYESALKDCLDRVLLIDPNFKSGLKQILNVRSRRIIQKYAPRWTKEFARKFLRY